MQINVEAFFFCIGKIHFVYKHNLYMIHFVMSLESVN